jgi:hypothetical protein
MDIEILLEAVTKNGIGAVVIIVLCFISYAIIKHILAQSNDILKATMIAQQEWRNSLDQHTSSAKEFHLSVIEGLRRAREEHSEIQKQSATIADTQRKTNELISNMQIEHKEMILTLGRINGYKDAH